MKYYPTVLLLLVAAACREPPPALDEMYRAGYAELHRGELQTAWDRAEEGRSRAAAQAEPAWEWGFEVLEAEVLASRRRHHEALDLLAVGLDATAPSDAVGVRALMTRGLVRCRLAEDGQAYRAAHEDLEVAARAAATVGSAPLQGEIELRRGTCYWHERRWPEAEASFESALDTARRDGILHLEANAAGSLGLVRTRTGRWDEATEWFERSRKIAARIDATVPLLRTSINLGWCYFELGDYERSLSTLRRAEALAADLSLGGDHRVTLTNMGRSFQEQRNWSEAEAHYSRALELAREQGNRRAMAHLLSNLAQVALGERRYEDAERYVHAALEIKKELGDEVGRQHSLITRGKILAARELTAEAEELCRLVIASPHTEPNLLWEAYGVLARLHARTGRTAEAEAEFRVAFKLMEESRGRLNVVGHRLSFFSSLKGFYDAYVRFLIQEGRPEEALVIAADNRARLIRERLERRADGTVTADDFRRLARRAGAVLLSYWTTPERSFLWVITSDRIELLTLPGEDVLRRDIETYRAAILRSRDPLAEAIAAGERLWRHLVAPAADWIPHLGRVVLVPDGPLHELNFETLVVPGPEPHYWIEDVVLASTPSLALLSPLELSPSELSVPELSSAVASSRAAVSASILIIGDPLPHGEEYPRLAHAGREVARIAGLFDPWQRAVYSGADATPPAYAAAKPWRFDFIHLAAHVTANREVPLESAVILSPWGEDYKLYARDVIDVALDADLVTLSACRSAGSRAFAGEGLVGLAWAFMNAGARNVVGGLWDVEDASTSQLMEELYRALRQGRDPAWALRHAKLVLLHSDTAYRKPYYWAPFVVYHGPAGLDSRS